MLLAVQGALVGTLVLATGLLRGASARTFPGTPGPRPGYALGLDLGDRSSVVAALDARGLRVLANRVGGRATPSALVFSSRERLCGERTAGGLAARHPKENSNSN